MIYLIRHGQSEWNLEGRTQGQTAHPGLTGLGRRQARMAAQAISADLAGRRVQSIVTSDLVRAVQTAEILARTFPAPIRLDRRWREQALGRLEGLRYQQVRRAVPPPPIGPDLALGGGESGRQVTQRVVAALGDLDRSAVTVVVSHGDTIRMLLDRAAGLEPGAGTWAAVSNGAVAALDPSRPDWGVRWLDRSGPAPTGRTGPPPGGSVLGDPGGGATHPEGGQNQLGGQARPDPLARSQP